MLHFFRHADHFETPELVSHRLEVNRADCENKEQQMLRFQRPDRQLKQLKLLDLLLPLSNGFLRNNSWRPVIIRLR